MMPGQTKPLTWTHTHLPCWGVQSLRGKDEDKSLGSEVRGSDRWLSFLFCLLLEMTKKKQPSGPTTKMNELLTGWFIVRRTGGGRRNGSPATVTPSGGNSDSDLGVKNLRVDKMYMRLVRKWIYFLFCFLDIRTSNVLQICKRQRWVGDKGDEVLTLVVWSEAVHPVMQTETWGFLQTWEIMWIKKWLMGNRSLVLEAYFDSELLLKISFLIDLFARHFTVVISNSSMKCIQTACLWPREYLFQRHIWQNFTAACEKSLIQLIYTA